MKLLNKKYKKNQKNYIECLSIIGEKVNPVTLANPLIAVWWDGHFWQSNLNGSELTAAPSR
jgi:hypothetical protein